MCNDTVLLTASNISTLIYYWEGPGITGMLHDSIVSVYVSGRYYFTLVDTNGCSSSNYVDVNIATSPPTPINPYMLDVLDSVYNDTIYMCYGDSVTISVFDSITDPLHQIIDNPVLGFWHDYYWTITPTVAYSCDTFPHVHLYPTVSGYYTLTFIKGNSNSCGGITHEVTDSFYIEIVPSPVLNLNILGNTSFCSGDSTWLVACCASDYLWHTYSGSFFGNPLNDSVLVLQPGVYYVKGFETNSFGCSAVDSVFEYVHYWSSPIISINPTSGVICPNDYATLSTISGCINYEWYGPTGIISTNSSSIQVNAAGYYFCIVTMPDSCEITSSTVEVKQYVTPFLIATPSDAICYGDSTMICLITNEESNYQWQYPLSGNETCQIITDQGTYICQVSSCGITTLANVDIVVLDPIADITALGPVIFCEGDSVILQANSGMETYEWFPGGEVVGSIVVYNSGYYSLSTTDEMGCQAISDTISVEVFDIFTPIVNDDSICSGQTSTLFATGANNYNWVLDSASTSPFETDSTWTTQALFNSVTYYVYSTNPGCISEHVPVNVIVYHPIADITALGPVIFCEGDSVILQANSGMEIYEWFPGGVGGESIVIYSSGDYSLTTTDLIGCQAFSNLISVEVFDIFTPIVNDDTICSGQTSTLFATGANNYNWVLDSVSTSPFETDSTWTTQALYNSVTYYVFSTNPACNSEHVPLNVIVLDSLETINPNLFSNSPVCDIDTIFLSSDADPLSDFYWSGPLGYISNDSLPIITNLSNLNSGIYSLYVNVDGCFSFQSSISVTVYSTPEISTSNDTLICINDQVELFAYGGVSYVWSPSTYLDDFLISNPISIPDSSISYNVTITDANNCTNSATVNIIVQNTPNLFYNLDTIIIVGESVEIFVNSDQNNLTYIWTPDYEISCLTCPNPIVTPLETTEYYLEFSDTLKCGYPYVSIYITVLDEFSLDLPQAFTPNGDGTNDIVYVRGWGIKELLEFRIYNRWGQEIFYTDDINQGWDGTYKGKLQNIDTYAYNVKVRFFNNQEFDKKGVISLLR